MMLVLLLSLLTMLLLDVGEALDLDFGEEAAFINVKERFEDTEFTVADVVELWLLDFFLLLFLLWVDE